MSIRFQADADLNQIIVAAIVRPVPRIDFKTATVAGLAGLNDPDVLALAGRDGRVLVSHDQTTMPKHFGGFVHSNQSPGLIIVPQNLPVREAVEDLILIWTATQAEEWINRMAYLPI